jgi:ArsR family transcriptional regulator
MAKALADGSRMRVVAALIRKDELCVCQIVEMLGLATGTVSRHMSVLQRAGIVQSRKDGRWVYYRLGKSFPFQLRDWLTETLVDSRQIVADQESVESILSCGTEVICRQKKP